MEDEFSSPADIMSSTCTMCIRDDGVEVAGVNGMEPRYNQVGGRGATESAKGVKESQGDSRNDNKV